MTFDDELRRAFDALTDQLRAEIDRQVQAAMDEVSASARTATEAAVEAAMASAPTLVNAPSPVAQPVEPLVDDSTAVTRLLDAVRTIDGAGSLTEILNALIASALREGIGAGVWLARSRTLTHWRSTGIDQPDADVPLDSHRALADAARANATAWDDGFAAPLAIGGHVVGVLYVTNRASPVPSGEIEILARHAASRLEALTAFKAARALTDRTDPAQVAAAADEAEDHVAAQRYARLLVSEIKLYHEAAVIEGRRDRDLATRLGGEIARARVMYEERVPSHIRQRADHFHDELVRTLADGDATLLELRA
ncbi:MAG TPA: hypothetical protein VKE51_39995 [Vicinamibacterales bacterium]|nr:hypothetical protein [Vicinamibacterales bacterium]